MEGIDFTDPLNARIGKDMKNMDNVVLLDGAVGTSLWEKSGNNDPVWQYNLTNPEIVKELSSEYVQAGAEMVLSNTFGINRIIGDKFGYNVTEVVTKAMELLHEAVDGRIPTGSPSSEPVKTILSSGPLTAILEPYGDLEEDECASIYNEILKAGVEGKPDYIWFQTFMDLNMMEVAVKEAAKFDIPVFCSLSFAEIGKTMFGNSPEDVAERLKPYEQVKAIGVNCSLGPDKAMGIIKQFHECTDLPIVFKPNAGIPITSADGSSTTIYDVDSFVKETIPAIEYGVKYIGGCCGTNPRYIEAMRKALGRS